MLQAIHEEILSLHEEILSRTESTAILNSHKGAV